MAVLEAMKELQAGRMWVQHLAGQSMRWLVHAGEIHSLALSEMVFQIKKNLQNELKKHKLEGNLTSIVCY